MLKIDRRLLTNFDWALFAFSLIIPLLSLVVLYSAGYDPDHPTNIFSWIPIEVMSVAFAKQSGFILMGLVAMILGLSIPTHLLQRYAFLFYIIGFLLLIVVLKFGVVVNGSRRWIDLGGFNLQPAEFMKMGIVLTMSRLLSKFPPKKPGGYSLLELVLPGILVFVPMALIAAQPDLGTAISLGIAGFSVIVFMGISWRTIATVVIGVCILAYPAWHALHDYQQRRIIVLLDPNVDPQGSGYHIIQSKIAVGSGSFFGKGFLEGTQTQLEFLPEHTTDFVFSVLAEEWGFVGCLSVLGLFFGLVSTMLSVAARSRDLFSCLVTFGITAQIFAHVVINVGMVLGIMPVVGIPLPLFSYGGSSLLSLMFSLGIVQGVSMRRLMFSSR